MGDVPTTERPGAIIGRVLRGKYRITRRLGSGGWGTVFEAEHLLLRRSVAIKLLHPDIAAEPKFAERFRREAVTLSRIGHPGIVEVIDIDRTDDGVDFIVLELLRGEALGKRLEKRRSLPLGEALGLFEQIADALRAAHEAGIVHRDLKPDNVFVCKKPDGTEYVKLLDFGVAKVAHGPTEVSVSITHTGALLGTPVYMSPEQVRTDRSLDHRTDIYSLGVLMYEALAGVLPFTSLNFAQLVIKILDEDPIPLVLHRSDIPTELSNTIMRMLSKEPAHRPFRCDEVLRMLRSVRGEPSLMLDPASLARMRAPKPEEEEINQGLAETVELRLVDPEEAVTRVAIQAITDNEVTRVAPMPTADVFESDDEVTKIAYPLSISQTETPRVNDALAIIVEPEPKKKPEPHAKPQPKVIKRIAEPKAVRRPRDLPSADPATTVLSNERDSHTPAGEARLAWWTSSFASLFSSRPELESSASINRLWIGACLIAFFTAAFITYFLMTH